MMFMYYNFVLTCFRVVQYALTVNAFTILWNCKNCIEYT